MQHDRRAQRTSPRGRLAAAVRRVIGLVARRRPALGRSLPSVAAGRRSTRLAAAYRAHAWWRVPLAAWMLSLLTAGTPTPGGAMGALQAAPGPLVIRYLDVGDGDATWVTMPDGSTVLVDCGPVSYGRQLVLQLEAAGVERVSRLALTNARANVVGGCADVIRYVSVDQVLWSGQGADTTTWRAFESLAATYRVPLRRNDAAQQPIDWGGGVIVHTLNPPGGLAGAGLDEYDGSQVLLLEYAGWRALFAGAIHQAGEQHVLDAGLRGSAVHVLKVADHGSAASTSDSFLAGIFGAGDPSLPRLAVVSYGVAPGASQPAPQTLARLRAAGASPLTTAGSGTVTITVPGDGAPPTVATER